MGVMAAPSIASFLARIALIVAVVMVVTIVAFIGWSIADYVIDPPVPTSMPVEIS